MTRYSHRPVISLAEMNEALVDLVHSMMWRWDNRTSYTMSELWGPQGPPERLEKTAMANQLDIVVGFHLSEEDLRKAVGLTDTTLAALYLYNLMLHRRELLFGEASPQVADPSPMLSSRQKKRRQTPE